MWANGENLISWVGMERNALETYAYGLNVVLQIAPPYSVTGHNLRVSSLQATLASLPIPFADTKLPSVSQGQCE